MISEIGVIREMVKKKVYKVQATLDSIVPVDNDFLVKFHVTVDGKNLINLLKHLEAGDDTWWSGIDDSK